MPKKTKKVQVGLTEEAYALLREQAAALGVSMSAYVAMVVNERLAKVTGENRVVTLNG